MKPSWLRVTISVPPKFWHHLYIQLDTCPAATLAAALLVHFLFHPMKTFVALLSLGLLSAPTLLHAQTRRPSTRPASAVQTQAPPPPSDEQLAPRAQALTTSMQKGLGLTPQQADKVQKINLNSMRSVENSRAQYRQDLRKMASVVDAVSQARLAALKDVLTPAQFDRYQRKREEKMGVPSTSAAQGNPVPGLPGGE